MTSSTAPLSPLIFYNYWRSSASWRVRWALELKGLAYQSIAIDLRVGEQRQPQFLQINPSGQVPVLVVGGEALTESIAILEWLEEKYPSPALLPCQPLARARVREVTMMVACGIHPLQNLKAQVFYSNQASERLRYAQHWIESGLRAVESRLQSTAGSFCVGGSLTMADLTLIPQCYNAERFGVAVDRLFPICYRIYQRCLQLPECIKSSPSHQSGAPGKP